MAPLLFAQRHARACLILGLLAGLFLPSVAAFLRPWLPALVAALLFLSAVRIGPRAALGGLRDARETAGIVLFYQVGMPLVALALVAALGLSGVTLALAVVLMLAAPPVTGSPNFTALMGHDPAPPMRVLILGTALFPLTVLPVLWLWPGLGDAQEVVAAALRLIAVIGLAVALGFAFRRAVMPRPSETAIKAVDGASAITLGIVVVGLMAAVGPALQEAPMRVAGWLLAVLVVNFGLQLAAFRVSGRVGYSVQAGNRNIALFLVALPASVTDALLLFIGCYQIPMYLTPMVMARLYRNGR